MDSLQPSLWDNVALESGYRELNELKFEAAVRSFSEALKMDMGQGETIRHALATAEYWRARVGQDGLSGEGSEETTRRFGRLLEEFAAYPFDGRMQLFKRNLLVGLTDRMPGGGELLLEEAETAFDLLLECRAYDRAKELLALLREQTPSRTDWLYMEAQVLWRNGERPRAAHLTAQALLSDPGSLAISRIEHPEVKALIAAHGAEKTPAYGWVGEVLPLVQLPEDLVMAHDRHEQALLAYDALRSAHLCLKNGDEHSSVRYRKDLKALDPALFEAYMPQARRRI